MEEAPPQAPKGWTYKTTMFTLQGFGDYDAEVRWELTDYAALGAGPGSDEWQKATMEFVSEFQDDRFRGSNAMMKSADEVFVPEGF